MKLIRMHIDNFGGLHDYDYQFEDGLNVVLQENGWGKTTMAAFLKAMLYGYDARRTKDITENERLRYLPWQGGTYGGTLEFESEGVPYRIYRTFGETPRFDTVRIINLETKTTAKIPKDKIGETLFHLDASAFQRSVFIHQNGLSINGAASSIHTRLNALVSQANDVAAYDDAIADLTQQVKVYEKTGARGQLGIISRQIDEQERARDRLERDIAEQDSARERISEITAQLETINETLTAKSKELDRISGEEKRREAAKKLLDEIDGQIKSVQEQMDVIQTELGGSVPSPEEIDRVKHLTKTAESLTSQLAELDSILAEHTASYQAMLETYGGAMPVPAQLDEIQAILGKLQGLLSAGADEAVQEEAPEEYALIHAAAETDPAFIRRLETAVGSQEEIRTLIRRQETANKALQIDEQTWEETQRRYAHFRAETSRRSGTVKALDAYRPETAGPAIETLEALQKKQQAIDLKRESLVSDALTPDQEALLRENTGELPDAAEGNAALKQYRDAARLDAEIQGLSARLEGENIRAKSLDASLEQLGEAESAETSAPNEPQKSSGKLLIGLGAVLAAAGAALGVLVMPALFAAAALGALLIVIGALSNSRYQKNLQAYNVWQSEFEKKQKTDRKRTELQSRKEEVRASAESLERQIEQLQSKRDKESAAVHSWFERWGAEKETPSEDGIIRILERADSVRTLRRKQETLESTQERIREGAAEIQAARAEVDQRYPECAGKAISDALGILREKTNAFRVAEEQYKTAAENEARFISETGAAREALEQPESPKKAELLAKKKVIAEELLRKLEAVNKTLSVLELDADQEQILQALREAESMLGAYRRYADRQKDRAEQKKKQKLQEEELRRRLENALLPISSVYPDQEILERLALIRADLSTAERLNAKIAELTQTQKAQSKMLADTENAIAAFKTAYGRSAAENGDVLQSIYERAGKFAELTAAKQQLEGQRASVGNDQKPTPGRPAGAEESALQHEVEALKARRDDLLIEYTHSIDHIRQADRSLESYPDTVQEIHDLYEQKQKAQNRLAILKRTIQLITRAKENLANRYLSKVEDLFNRYLHIWMNDEALRGILDIDFNVTIEENDKIHVAEGYSTGVGDLIDFCMRLALVDTLFEKEQPFLILDDPFVNLDEDRLEKALELLSVMAATRQIIYFVCHPIRAVEAEQNSSSRRKFQQIAAETRQTLREKKAAKSSKKPVAKKNPRDLYHLGQQTAPAIAPERTDYVITNSIFGLNFILIDGSDGKDHSYELFFVDAAGHVLNERKRLEVRNGKLSAERLQFSLNTREDSGDQYELMIQETGQDDYEVAARIPFRAKLAFAGTFSFD